MTLELVSEPKSTSEPSISSIDSSKTRGLVSQRQARPRVRYGSQVGILVQIGTSVTQYLSLVSCFVLVVCLIIMSKLGNRKVEDGIKCADGECRWNFTFYQKIDSFPPRFDVSRHSCVESNSQIGFGVPFPLFGNKFMIRPRGQKENRQNSRTQTTKKNRQTHWTWKSWILFLLFWVHSLNLDDSSALKTFEEKSITYEQLSKSCSPFLVGSSGPQNVSWIILEMSELCFTGKNKKVLPVKL